MNQSLNPLPNTLFGIFDGIHINTIEFLTRLHLQPCNLVVLNQEESQQALNLSPILPFAERCEMLEALSCVAHVYSISQFQKLPDLHHIIPLQTPELPVILKSLQIEPRLQQSPYSITLSEIQINHQLLAHLSKGMPFETLSIQQKPKNLLTQDELTAFLAKTQSQRLVTTNGSFDWLHLGHIRYLQQAKQKGDCLIVLVNSDESIRERKGESRPIFDLDSRLKTLASLECVDFVLPFFEDTPLKMLSQLKPALHIKGGSFEETRILEEKQLLESWGGKFESLPMIGDFSSSKFLSTLRQK